MPDKWLPFFPTGFSCCTRVKTMINFINTFRSSFFRSFKQAALAGFLASLALSYCGDDASAKKKTSGLSDAAAVAADAESLSGPDGRSQCLCHWS